MKRRPAKQLDREIAEFLRPRHATVRRGDQWDVAMDALMEGDEKRAAKIVREIREEHGAQTDPTAAFSKAVREAPADLRKRFFDLTEADLEDLGKETYRNFTVAEYFYATSKSPGPVTYRYFRADRPVTWTTARDRIGASGIVKATRFNRITKPGGWLLSVLSSDFRHDEADPLP